MRDTLLLGYLLTVALVGSAQAGPMRSAPCKDVPNASVTVSAETLVGLRGIDVGGIQFNATFRYSGSDPYPLTLIDGSPTTTPGVAGGFFDVQVNMAQVHCLYADHAMYSAELFRGPGQMWGIARVGLTRDLSSTTVTLPLSTGPSELSMSPNGTALLDGYSGQWSQQGNSFFVNILGGASNGTFTVGPTGLTGMVHHFGYTTNVSNVPPKETSILLNNNRFRAAVTWRSAGMSNPVPARTVRNGDESGLFWFFDPNNTELLVKVLNACPVNNRYWVFASGLTNVEATLTVTDTQSGSVKTYFKPLGQASPAVTDTDAFATCP